MRTRNSRLDNFAGVRGSPSSGIHPDRCQLLSQPDMRIVVSVIRGLKDIFNLPVMIFELL
ncbi:hypothetical protein SAMN05216311_107210 [Chitinophaga sp. CF418]|nr:hypothetical protein SAMN05216311_107210 [Chitinophaga sp. CF418]